MISARQTIGRAPFGPSPLALLEVRYESENNSIKMETQEELIEILSINREKLSKSHTWTKGNVMGVPTILGSKEREELARRDTWVHGIS